MSEPADYRWLTGSEAHILLEEVSLEEQPLHVQLQRLEKIVGPERARLVVDQISLRKRAREKFGTLASRMFFTDRALQQATDLWVGRYKASRVKQGELVHDFCCGLGGDLLAFAARGASIGWELAPEIAEFARANLRLTADSPGCAVRCKDVEGVNPVGDSWHIDPDRRPAGRRSVELRWHQPSSETIERWLIDAPAGIIKLAPAAEIPRYWSETVEQEWISRDRQCRQLVVWHGELAAEPGRRRATCVVVDDHAPWGFCSHTFVGTPQLPVEHAEAVRRYVYEFDPAVRAAKLSGTLANKLELCAIGGEAGYFTSARQVADPLSSCFEVLEEFPLRAKPLAKALRQRNIGRLEIKKRGVQYDPERLRRELKLTGNEEATLLLTKLGKRQIAVLARRV